MIDAEPLGARVTLAADESGRTLIKALTPAG
jgi:hypothetical protein